MKWKHYTEILREKRKNNIQMLDIIKQQVPTYNSCDNLIPIKHCIGGNVY